MDLAERLEALQEKNSASSVPATEEELKSVYLDLIAEGDASAAAARKLGKTGRWFRSRRSVNSEHYDEAFALRYEEIMHPDGEHREAVVQTARAALIKAAQDGNVRAIEKILMAYDPDFNFLRPAAFAGDTYNVDKLIQIMPGIPTHLLEQMKDELVSKRQRELPILEA